jgi:hypothetical protein
LALLSHAGTIVISLLAFRISIGEHAALVNSRHAGSADLIARAGGSRVSEWNRSRPERCDHGRQSEVPPGRLLAALLVFGSASAVLADTNNRTDHHGSVADELWAVNSTVKPLTAEETAWFAAPRLALLQSAPFCLKSASGAANCTYHTLILCEQAKHPNSLDQCIPHWKVL